MKKLSLLLFLISGFLFSQENNVSVSPDFSINKIFDGGVEQEAQYPGGIEALRNFVATHIEYPITALDNRTEGRVMAKLIVEKDGAISDITITKDIGDGCGDEVIKVLYLTSGKWKPAQINGMPVRSVYRFPVVFRLPKNLSKTVY